MRNDFGGSTITQQLIKNITKQDDITVQRKLLEIFQALDLEKKYSKEEIIEWYLNVVYFGEGSYGVQAAAQTYFGKDAADLDLAECAAIAGITNLPTYYDPFYSKANNKKRQETILNEMYGQGYISKAECDSAKAEELNFVRGENEEYTQTIYTYYEETVISDVVADLMKQQNLTQSAATTLLYNGGYTIYSCIDPSIQAKVDAVYTNLDALPKAYANPTGQQLQSAIVIMGMLCAGLQLHQVNHIDHPYFQIRQIFPQYGYSCKGFQRRSVAAAGHYDIRFIAPVIACPPPYTDALSTMSDRSFHIQPLWPGVFGCYNHIYIISASQTMVDNRKQAISVRRKVNAHNIGFFIRDMYPTT